MSELCQKTLLVQRPWFARKSLPLWPDLRQALLRVCDDHFGLSGKERYRDCRVARFVGLAHVSGVGLNNSDAVANDRIA